MKTKEEVARFIASLHKRLYSEVEQGKTVEFEMRTPVIETAPKPDGKGFRHYAPSGELYIFISCPPGWDGPKEGLPFYPKDFFAKPEDP